MDGMLSQDEINALLSGLAAGEPLPEPEPTVKLRVLDLTTVPFQT